MASDEGRVARDVARVDVTALTVEFRWLSRGNQQPRGSIDQGVRRGAASLGRGFGSLLLAAVRNRGHSAVWPQPQSGQPDPSALLSRRGDPRLPWGIGLRWRIGTTWAVRRRRGR